MNGHDRIEKNVVDGLVMDEQGQWVPIAAKLAQEREFLRHLENGEVLHQKRWMPIAEMKALQNQISSGTPKASEPAVEELRVSDVKKMVKDF
jgi:hypothetical protein